MIFFIIIMTHIYYIAMYVCMCAEINEYYAMYIEEKEYPHEKQLLLMTGVASSWPFILCLCLNGRVFLQNSQLNSQLPLEP